MTWLLKINLAVALLAFIIWQCEYQKKQFADQKKISHFGKATIYGLFALGLTALLVYPDHWNRAWQIPLIALIERTALFDFTLSIIRKKPLFYNGDMHGLLKGKSLQDWIENKLPQGIVRLLKIVYIIVFIIVLIVL